jgi:hypothetical protein
MIMKTHPLLLLLALCLALGGPLVVRAATDAVVQPLNDPDGVPPGPMCFLPPLAQELPAAPPDNARLESVPHEQPPLLCACLPLDFLENLT